MRKQRDQHETFGRYNASQKSANSVTFTEGEKHLLKIVTRVLSSVDSVVFLVTSDLELKFTIPP